MILGTSVASSTETSMIATLLMGLVARFHYRAGPRTLHLLPIMLSDRGCSCWIVLRRSRNATAHTSPVRSVSRDFRTRLPTRTRKGIDEEGALLRAADLIGQLGDPH